jgi:hypothetical protein
MFSVGYNSLIAFHHNQGSSEGMFAEKSVCIELSLSEKDYTQQTAAGTIPYKSNTRTRFTPSPTLYHYQTSHTWLLRAASRE